MFRRWKMQIKMWAATEIFKLYFGSFIYPFDKADRNYEKLPAYRKAKYLKDIHNWVSSEAYKMESQEILRKWYQELAVKPLDNATAVGYRLAIMVEKDKQQRLIKKDKEYSEIVNISD